MSNYTSQMIEQIENAQPLNLEIAKKLATEFGLSHRSIISKAKQMGFEYVAKAKPAKKAITEPTKAEILGNIRNACELADRDGDLTKAELQIILQKLA